MNYIQTPSTQVGKRNNYLYYGGIITLIIICIYVLYKIIIFYFFKPIDGKFTEWSDWSTCSASCSGGTTTRTRECIPPINGGKKCNGALIETDSCNQFACEKKIKSPVLYNCVITARGLTGTELLTFLDKDFNQFHQQRLTTDFKNFTITYYTPIYIVFENPTIRNQIEFKQFNVQGEEYSLKNLQFIMFKDIEQISNPDDPTLKEDILEFYEQSLWLSSLANKGFFILK